MDIRDYCISQNTSLAESLKRLNEQSSSTVLLLFVVDDHGVLVGSLTDGDVRRGLLGGADMQSPVSQVMFRGFTYATPDTLDEKIKQINTTFIKLLPIVDNAGKLIDIVNLLHYTKALPVEAIIMAGGEGRRLRPLTDATPKPLLHVGNKPIIEHNIDRLIGYGIEKICLSVKYKGEQLRQYFANGEDKGIAITYVEEEEPLGTIGAVSLVDGISKNTVLLMNSDLLTNIDFGEMYQEFERQQSDLMVATIPYKVDIPYAVMETKGENVVSFKEKPTYTYQSNAGIYLFKKEMIELIPRHEFYNATDLMEKMIRIGKKVSYFPILGYWLDIGRHEDLQKAQQDIKHLKL